MIEKENFFFLEHFLYRKNSVCQTQLLCHLPRLSVSKNQFVILLSFMAIFEENIEVLSYPWCDQCIVHHGPTETY